MFLKQMCAELGGRGKTRYLKSIPREQTPRVGKEIPELGKKRRQRLEREGGLRNASCNGRGTGVDAVTGA